MTRYEHRALAERQIEESDRLFAEYEQRTAGGEHGEFSLSYARISHLRQSAAVHATLAALPEATE